MEKLARVGHHEPRFSNDQEHVEALRYGQAIMLAGVVSRRMSMKVVILAGGLGTRIAEETTTRPKPMVEIGGRAILWHILQNYNHHGFKVFVICVGYKAYVIKEYFANYFLHMSDVTFHLAENRMEVHRESAEPWRVTLVDTGEETQTGGRPKRGRPYVAA